MSAASGPIGYLLYFEDSFIHVGSGSFVYKSGSWFTSSDLLWYRLTVRPLESHSVYGL